MDPGYYLALVIILTVSVLVIVFHKQIVNWLTPVTKWLHGFVRLSHLSTMISNINNLQVQSWLAGPNCCIVRYLVPSRKQFRLLLSILCVVNPNIPLAVRT